jgi:tryptophan-rich sensory protein
VRGTTQSRQWQVAALAGWLIVTFAVAAAGAIASADAPDFYGALAKPSWAPPASVFGPVWTVLYALMAFAAWLVWRCGGWAANRRALTLFLAQLVVNALWSWLFFAWRQGAWAFADIVLLWAAIAATVVAFARVQVLAATLLAPYFLWVSFAAALNYSVWKLNPNLLG